MTEEIFREIFKKFGYTKEATDLFWEFRGTEFEDESQLRAYLARKENVQNR